MKILNLSKRYLANANTIICMYIMYVNYKNKEKVINHKIMLSYSYLN